VDTVQVGASTLARIRNTDVVQGLRECLSNEGYSFAAEKEYGVRGVDIIAKCNNATYHIEVIGYKGPGAGSTRAR